MSVTPIKVLLFDIGNVLLRLKVDEFHRKLAAQCRPDLRPDDLELALWEEGGLHHAFERGQISSEAFHAHLVDRLGLILDHAGWVALWNDFFLPNRPMDALLGRLRGQARFWALSNTNEEHLKHIRLHYRVLDGFEGVLASQDLGERKPDEAIYRAALKRLGVAPGEVFFIDDNPANIEGARAVGLRTFHYQFNDRELRQALVAEGFDIEEGKARAAAAC